MRIEIDKYHPGIPGYDVTYAFSIYYTAIDKEHLLNTCEYYLECDIPQIEIQGNRVTVPAKFKDNTEVKQAVITAYHRKDRNISASYILPIKCWKKTIADEFDGTEVNDELWDYEGDPAYAFEEVPGGKTFSRSTDALSLEDSNLVMKFMKPIHPTKMNDGSYKTPDYNLGSLYSRFEQKFGCFQTSILLPKGGDPGCNPAFWLIPGGKGYNKEFMGRHKDGPFKDKYCGEIDIIEYSAQWVPAKYVITDHWWHGVDKYHEGDWFYYENDDLWKGYSNIALVWTEDAYYYYFNGKLVRTTENLDMSEAVPGRVVLSLGAAGYGEKNPSWIGYFDDSNIDRATTRFDYVRLFK